jgi:hypothetical protein
MSGTTIKCPNCGSSGCKTAAAIHASGTRSRTGNFGGVRISARGRISTYGGTSSSSTSSPLAERFAPPDIPLRVSALEIVGSFMTAAIIAGFPALIIAFVVAALTVSDENSDFVMFPVMLGIMAYVGWWWISNRKLPLYGKAYDALAVKHTADMLQYERTWVCTKCLNAWLR